MVNDGSGVPGHSGDKKQTLEQLQAVVWLFLFPRALLQYLGVLSRRQVFDEFTPKGCTDRV